MPNPPAMPALLPRKTPRQQRSANTVATILQAAAHILEEAGLDGYTTNAVAARAGVSIGSVYQYFPHRDAVTRALIERRSEELLTAILQIDGTARGRDGIRHVIGIAVVQQLRHARLARILDLEEARMPASDAMRENGKRAAAAIRTYLEQAGVPGIDMDTVVRDVMAITLGMVDAAGRHGEADEHALLRRVLRAVFGYLDAIPEA
jgi:AcrR family transcriptional regulator